MHFPAFEAIHRDPTFTVRSRALKPHRTMGLSTLGGRCRKGPAGRCRAKAEKRGLAAGISGQVGSRRLHEMSRSADAWIALAQGAFYVATGVWALVDLDSFMAVTGPKADLWLVKTVGALVTLIGAVLLVAGRRSRVTSEIVLLAVGSALSLATIDVVYVSVGRISPIYLLDAAAEVGLAGAWAVARRRG